MSRQRGYSVFPATFLTFSLLLLVLAAGFAVGRLVIGRAYLKSAGQFEKLPIGKPQTGGQAAAEPDQTVGQGYVPAPAEQSAEPQERPKPQQAAPPDEQPEGLNQDMPAEVAPPSEGQQDQPLPAEETPKPSEQRERRYAIQIGLFESQEGAQQVADDLARAGYPARVERSAGDSGAVYRVVTGRYRTEYAARKAMDQLRQEGFPGFLVER